MKTVNANTRKGRGFIFRYIKASITDIKEAYKEPSVDKIIAYNKCKKLCSIECGKNFRILGHNSFFFTVAWQAGNNLRVDTGKNSYLILSAF